jgi:polyvinyl alcohol dehydrogenase (cytochrome)
MFGSNICNTRSTGAAVLNKRNASTLAVKWKFQAGGDISATPAVVDNDLFVPDFGGSLNKINASTGQLVWSISVGALIGASDAGTGAQDAPAPVVSRTTPLVTSDSVIFGVNRGASISAPAILATLVAVDRTTGALKWQTTVDGHPTAHITSSPVINNGTIYVGVASDEEFFSALPVIAGVNYPCCSFRGSAVALNASTGQIIWKTYTIEDSAYFETDGKTPSGYAGAAVWAAPTIDRNRNSVYITTGNNYSQPAGAGALPPGDHIESIMSLDLATGAIKWSQRMSKGDVWNLLTFYVNGPTSGGPDWDFGTSAVLYSTTINGNQRDVLGAGQKSGMYWALDPATGNVLWVTAVGPGGHLGGIHWGTAFDGKNIYVGVNDELGVTYGLGGSGPEAGEQVNVGSWAALNPSNGSILWQVANPAMSAPNGNGTSVNGPVSAVSGVMFGGSMDANGTMFALDGATGAVLWSFQSGATVYGGPAIVNGTVYWGNGYPFARLHFGTPGGTLYAFSAGGQ